MTVFSNIRIANQDDLARFEEEKTLDQRLPETSILDVFVNQAAARPEHTAITMLMSGERDEQPRRVNYRELIGLVRRAANLFSSLAGPRPGVAYMLPSLVETHATLWGAETAGYAVPINFLLKTEHIVELLKASGTSILVTLGPHPALDIWQKALELRELVPGLILLRVSPPQTPAEDGVLDFHSALMAQPDDHLVFDNPGRGDDVAAYFHTGGTTGAPKLVAHTHRGQLVAALGGVALADMQENDILTGTLPLFHVAGTIFSGLSAFMAGLELIVMSPAGLRNPAMVEGFWRIVAQYKATLVGSVPTAVGAVLEIPVDGEDISCVRAGFCGAALLPPAIGQRFRQVTGCGLFEVYGMTEASGLISIDPVAGIGGPGSVGWPLPYTGINVSRLDGDGQLGEECQAGEIGVITISGEHVSPGYRNPDHNDGVFENGLLISGDLGYKDEQGRIFLSGRSKDLIIRSGHNIDPSMIENAMATHPDVALAAAVGMPDVYAGELPVCFVEFRPDCEATEEELHQHARQSIGERPAWPKHFIIVDNIPLTTVGKIYKPQLRCEAASRLVSNIVRQQMGLTDSHIMVVEGGARGMKVTVNIPKSATSSISAIEKELAGYIFETEVLAG